MNFLSKANAHLRLVLMLCSLLTVIEVINLFAGRAINNFGLIPRNFPGGLVGIFFAPVLHASVGHYLSNILPFAVFTFLVLRHGISRYFMVTVIVVLLSGSLVWLFGRSAVHVGASGLIYGYFGFLLVSGVYARKLKIILIAVLVGFFYGGLIWGVLPTRYFVSWESHLFGFIAGAFSSCALYRKP